MMSAPRLQIDLDRIRHNARTLVERLGRRGVVVTGVKKATLGSARIAATLIEAGVKRLGDSRIENTEAMILRQVSGAQRFRLHGDDRKRCSIGVPGTGVQIHARHQQVEVI